MVEPAGVAQVVSSAVTSPQRCGGGSAVYTLTALCKKRYYTGDSQAAEEPVHGFYCVKKKKRFEKIEKNLYFYFGRGEGCKLQDVFFGV